MAFEILDPLPPFSSLSPARRAICLGAALLGIVGVIWACDIVLRAPELMQAQQTQKPAHR
jgi:hypothetical protein